MRTSRVVYGGKRSSALAPGSSCFARAARSDPAVTGASTSTLTSPPFRVWETRRHPATFATAFESFSRRVSSASSCLTSPSANSRFE